MLELDTLVKADPFPGPGLQQRLEARSFHGTIDGPSLHALKLTYLCKNDQKFMLAATSTAS